MVDHELEFDESQELAYKDVEEFYILGTPIKTQIGNCHFIKVKDFPNFAEELNALRMPKEYFINEIKDISENMTTEEIKEVEGLNLWELVLGLGEIRAIYEKVFTHFFKDSSAFQKIESEEEFMYLRELILRMSCETEEIVNPNPEIQKANERSRRLKAEEGEKMTFADVVSSVSANKGISYSEIAEMTLYQLYMDFYRIEKRFSYETSTLFATVGEVKVRSWSEHITFFDEEKHYVTQSEFNKDVKSKI